MKRQIITYYLFGLILISCSSNENKTVTNTQNVNITAAQTDQWQNIGSITVYTGAYTTEARSAILYVKNVYGSNYYQIKVGNYNHYYGVEENPHFLDKKFGGREQYRYKHKAGNYYLNIPGSNAAAEVQRLEEQERNNKWIRIRSNVRAYKIWDDGDFVYTEMDIWQKQDGSGVIKLKSRPGCNDEEWIITKDYHILRSPRYPYEERVYEYKAGPYSLKNI